MLLIFKPIQRILNNPSLVALIFFAASLYISFYLVGDWLFPVLISVVIAYLLEAIISKMEKLGMRRIFAVYIVFIIFISVLAYAFFTLWPPLISQARSLIENLPKYISLLTHYLNVLPQKFPQFIDQSAVDQTIANLNNSITLFSSEILSLKIYSSLVNIISAIVYIILVPILVFFMLKDKEEILSWLGKFMPNNRSIITEIWAEVDQQIGNYIRGKFLEIAVIWFMCFVPFKMFSLQYSLLLSLLVGLSVLIPYIGATVVTIPVLTIAYMQFGAAASFYWIAIIYFIIQILDGNVIVPIIFSEAVSIHPVGIIVAILVFGGMWGFWGVFFSIPFATVVKAVIEAWRRYEHPDFQLGMSNT